MMAGNQQESFQSMATVFILQDKTWIERGSGPVRFVFDLRTFALRLVIRPNTPEEFECKLRPRIRSKGPRAYVVRAQAENGTDEHILAVRFEREEDSRSFRRFVEKRDVDHNQKSSAPAHPPANQYQQHMRNTTYDNSMQQQQAQYAHRHGNRAASNIAQQGYGYGGAPMNRAPPYSQNMPMYPNNSNMPQGPPPQAGASGHSKRNTYFWTCSLCLQMVDITLSACHVCGTLRQNDGTQPQPPPNGPPPVMPPPMGGAAGNNYSSHSHHAQHHPHHSAHHHPHAPPPHHVGVPTHHASYSASNTNRTTHGSSAVHPMASTSMNSNPNYSHYSGNPQMMSNQSMQSNSGYYAKNNHSQEQHSKPAPTVHILKLTQVNLEKHNKQYPPKRRNVKEIIHTQLEWLRTHQ